MLREGRVIEKVQMKQRASTTSLEDVARLQKQSDELEKVCVRGDRAVFRRLKSPSKRFFIGCESSSPDTLTVRGITQPL